MRNKPLPTLFYRSIATVSLLLAMLCAGTVKAQTYYFPGTNYGYTGGANVFPWAQASSGSNMCQWLFTTSDFNALPTSNAIITTIYFKPAATTTATITNLQIKLMNTTLSTLGTGAVTWYTGLTTVYFSSSVTLSTTSGSWYAITLPTATPFIYVPGNNILMEISTQNTAGNSLSINQFTVTGRTGRMYGNSNNPASNGADGATTCFGFDSVPAACAGMPTAGNITTTPFAAASPLCAGNTTSITGVDPNGGISGLIYQWQSAPSSTGPWTNVSGGSGATTLTYTTGAVTASTYYRLAIICTNSNLTAYSAPFLVPVGTPQPGPINGRPTFCPGDTATYYVNPVSGSGATYSWTLPPGWTGASTSNSIFVTMGGTNAGTISVTATSSCGPTSIARNVTILPGSAPATPAVINGSNAVCAGSTQTYTVTPVVGATSYIWTLPSGYTGTSTGPSITLTTGTASGTLRVKSANGCGNSTDATLAISIINSLANPGPITGAAAVCSGTLQNYSISPVSGATSYVWTLPSGWSGTTTGTSIQAFAGTSGGAINVTAYVSCATSAISSLTTTVTPSVTPTVSVATPAAICQNALTTFNASATNTGTAPVYQWKKNGVNVLAVGPTYTDNTLVSGDLISVDLTSNATCTSSPTTTSNVVVAAVTPAVTPGISINTVPPIVLCAGTPISFVTTATGTGTQPTYQWYLNNVAISGQTGTTFNTSALANGDTLTVRMTTNAACATAPVATSNKVGFKVNPAVVPSVTVNASSMTGGTGQYITFTAAQSGGGATPAYQWVLNGVDIPGEQHDTYTSGTLMPGDHVSVRLQSYDPCATPGVVLSNEVILQAVSTGVGSVAGTWSGAVKLYPNPSTGVFTVSLRESGSSRLQNGGKLRLEVLNVVGQRVYSNESAMPAATAGSEQRYEVRVGDGVPAGQYLLRLSSADGSLNAALPFIISK